MVYTELTEALRQLCTLMAPTYIGRAHAKVVTKVKDDGTPVTDLDNYTLGRFRELIKKGSRDAGRSAKKTSGPPRK